AAPALHRWPGQAGPSRLAGSTARVRQHLYQVAERLTLGSFARAPPSVMAGLDPAICCGTEVAVNGLFRNLRAGGDGRVKPGHDGRRGPVPYVNLSTTWYKSPDREIQPH